MESKNQISILISELKSIADKSITKSKFAVDHRYKIINQIETDLRDIPDFLWDSISTESFESPSNQYSMF